MPKTKDIECIYSVVVILTGGLDTTHVTLTSALSLLLNNPKALKMAQEELDAHVGIDRLVEESDITNLVYLQAIVKETLHLHPPSQISPARESIDNCVVAGYNIPKGTRLMWSKNVPRCFICNQDLASALQGFELAKPSKDPVDANESFTLTDIKDFPVEVILSPRLSIDMYHYANE
ncbi:cytochrome P450 CYP82D47-like protein [Tanacetum coccineum]